MSQPDTFPDGIWQPLLKHALILIDEIREHGGVADPFFTFGGGTVLMLRHAHRLSKDIDFFVPDPQSLGFVSPRLSDVAETICNSQYVEANEYIKLFVEGLGEIDIVAKPNLLPNKHAFETWNLFGKPIRVETSAEIVAKKMYHRGDRATARDLFDLALVIEREPDAMKLAQPFFFRHAIEFAHHISNPLPGFIEKFLDIETLGYNPTLDQATNIVLNYLDELQIDAEKSAKEAAELVKRKGLNVEIPDYEHGTYIGKAILSTAHHLIQHVGRNKAVIHEKHRLPVALQIDPEDALFELRYSKGTALTPSKNSRSHSHER